MDLVEHQLNKLNVRVRCKISDIFFMLRLSVMKLSQKLQTNVGQTRKGSCVQ
jgi:hypothetical protein